MLNVLYELYARKLERAVRSAPMPEHVAVILDGNRRYAQEKGLPSSEDGHRLGAEKIFEFLDWCQQLDIRWVTLWMLSSDNLQREESELSALVKIIDDTIKRLREESDTRWAGSRFSIIGSEIDLPEPLRTTLSNTQQSEPSVDGLNIQMALAYGGREEITEAFRRLLVERLKAGDQIEDVIDDLSPEMIGNHIWTANSPAPDLIIRTSGEIRLSGFMLWQSVHSEFYFCDPYWPEFRRIDFLRALREFGLRNRRFGK